MKKLMIIFSVIMIIIGILGIISAIILWYSGEDMIKWIGAIVLSLLIILSNIIRLKNID